MSKHHDLLSDFNPWFSLNSQCIKCNTLYEKMNNVHHVCWTTIIEWTCWSSEWVEKTMRERHLRGFYLWRMLVIIFGTTVCNVDHQEWSPLVTPRWQEVIRAFIVKTLIFCLKIFSSDDSWGNFSTLLILLSHIL